MIPKVGTAKQQEQCTLTRLGSSEAGAVLECRVINHTLTSACGYGVASLTAAIEARESPLRPNDYPHSDVDTWIGRVAGLEDYKLPDSLAHLHSRNNLLADAALDEDDFDVTVMRLVEAFGRHRVGTIIGTSTSSIGDTERGFRHLANDDRMPSEFHQPNVHNPHAPGHYVAQRFGLSGPAMTISTACSSSGKVFAAGARWLRAGLVDAVVVGGIDSLCLSIVHGFASLELTSPAPCRPFDVHRSGISIGEAGGFAALTLAAGAKRIGADSDLVLRGYGETSDAYHMAHPHPEGAGARRCMQDALAQSELAPDDIDYVNLHGTASRANDLAETLALAAVFPETTTVSSTKAYTGHTLGAAGITGAIVALETLKSGYLPGTLNLDTPDPELAFPIARDNLRREATHVMANSFGFGGNNCSLVFSRRPLQ